MCVVSFADVPKWQKPLFVLSFVPMDVELTEKEFLPARFLWGTHASLWDLCPFSRSDQVSHERFTDASAWSNKKRSAGRDRNYANGFARQHQSILPYAAVKHNRNGAQSHFYSNHFTYHLLNSRLSRANVTLYSSLIYLLFR